MHRKKMAASLCATRLLGHAIEIGPIEPAVQHRHNNALLASLRRRDWRSLAMGIRPFDIQRWIDLLVSDDWFVVWLLGDF